MNVEIRIFANPAGFVELRLNSPATYMLFQDAVVEKRNFDGQRGELPNGTFSVYYTKDAYVIAYHFLLPSDAQFRDQEAHIAVAIRRGFKLLEPTITFQELASELAKIAVEFKSSAANKIFYNTEKFYNIVNKRIVEDPLQFNFNTTYSVAKRAILAVKSAQERDIVLSDPFRKDFKDINILFIINYEDGAKVGQLISSGYRTIPNLGFQDSRIFTLVYPDGHRVEFTDFNQELPVHTINRPYENPLTFVGSLGANWDKWKVSVSEDKTEYKIGLLPEKERKTFKVIAFDQKGHELEPSLISVSFGQFRDGQWTLEGEEIAQIKRRNVKDIFSVAGYTINSTLKEIDESTLCFNACKLYSYDLSELFKFLNESACQDAVTIHSKSTGKFWTINKVRFPWDIPYSEVYVHVPETATTEETNLDIDSLGRISLSALKKKKTGEIKVLFDSHLPNELKKKLSHNEKVGSIVYQYNVPRTKRLKTEECIISTYPIVIPGLPLLPIHLEIEIEGYKKFQEEVNLKNNPNKEVVCPLSPTPANRLKCYCMKHLPTFIVGVILGIFLGFWIANTWNRFFPPNSDNISNRIEQLRQDSVYQQEEIERLTSTIRDLLEQPQEASMVGKVDESSTSAPPDTNVDISNLTSEQESLIKKLKGVDFTMDDVQKALESLAGKGYDNLIADANACLKILNLDKTGKKELLTPKSASYNLHYKKLGWHKSSMNEIIKSEPYQTTTESFNSINEMKKYIDENK